MRDARRGGSHGQRAHLRARLIAAAHEIDRPLLRFVIDAADVLADDADADQLDSADEQHHRNQRRVTRHRIAQPQRARDDEPAVEERERRDAEPDVGPTAQRHRAEARDPFEREVPELPAGEFRVARAARLALILDDHGPVAHPREQPLHEAPALRQAAQRVDDLPVHQPEIADVDRQLHFGQRIVHAVIQRGGGALRERVARAVAALRRHDLGAVAPMVDHHGNQARRILQVRVDRDHRVAVRFVEARRQRGFLAEVARQIDHAHARLARADRDELLERVVAAAVVHADDLEADRFDRLHQRHHFRKEPRDRVAFVVERHDERNERYVYLIPHDASP